MCARSPRRSKFAKDAGAALYARPAHADLHYRRACVLLRMKLNAEARLGLDKARGALDSDMEASSGVCVSRED